MVKLSPFLVVVVAILGLASAQSYDAWDLEGIDVDDKVLTYDNFTYTLYAKSLAENEEPQEIDEATANENARLHPSIAEDSRLLTVCYT